ncbi:MAG: type II toxin-antitoxin system VapC family toxin [Candidatus Azobacteroides sp.]|nr:type II toxin-antitoxin system VapC family toxin [Candidatus Azobacteroides sp.]
MNLLLDTHSVIWFFNGDAQLSEKAKKSIINDRNTKFVSMASIWEVSIKINLKKLIFHRGMKGFVKLIENNGFEILPISKDCILQSEKVNFVHKDPFDRLIIATAIAGKMKVITTDESFKFYKIPIIR